MKSINDIITEAAKKPKMVKVYRITKTHWPLRGDKRTYKMEGTLEELIRAYSYTLECGKSWEHERGNKKINMNPKNIKALCDNLYKASNNSTQNGYSGDDYTWEEIGEIEAIKPNPDSNVDVKESAEDGKNGRWEEFYDEDTGEVVSMWIDDKPEEIVKAVKEATPEELQKLKELRKAFDKLDDQWYETSDELVDAKHRLRALKDELREIQYDMEEEIGHAKTDEERDRLGNEYGDQLEDNQKQTNATIINIHALTKKKDELREKVDDASNELWKYEQKIGYHAHRGGKVSKY